MLLAVPTLLLVAARWRALRTVARYGRIPNRLGLTGRQVARAILDANGLDDVSVDVAPGHLTDHYDARRRTLCLSAPVFAGCSVAALGIAAHETGHALQDRTGYLPRRAHVRLIPAITVGSTSGWLMFLAGVIARLGALGWLGVALVAAAALLAPVTLSVELDASRRALAMLTTMGFVDEAEARQSRAVLNAAVLTYLAGSLAVLPPLPGV